MTDLVDPQIAGDVDIVVDGNSVVAFFQVLTSTVKASAKLSCASRQTAANRPSDRDYIFIRSSSRKSRASSTFRQVVGPKSYLVDGVKISTLKSRSKVTWPPDHRCSETESTQPVSKPSRTPSQVVSQQRKLEFQTCASKSAACSSLNRRITSTRHRVSQDVSYVFFFLNMSKCHMHLSSILSFSFHSVIQKILHTPKEI